MCIFHRWGKWGTTEEGPIQQRRWNHLTGAHSLFRIGRWATQERICGRCGKLQMKSIRRLL